jgi:hypothetical protein
VVSSGFYDCFEVYHLWFVANPCTFLYFGILNGFVYGDWQMLKINVRNASSVAIYLIWGVTLPSCVLYTQMP